MSVCRYDRRAVLRNVLVGLAVLPVAGVVREVAAAEAATLPHLDLKDPLAVAMGYVHNVDEVDPAKETQFKAGSDCANCMHVTGKDGDEWRPCNIFPGKLVNAHGWCRAWVKKPGA